MAAETEAVSENTEVTVVDTTVADEDAQIESAHLSPATTEALLVNGTAFPPNAGGGITEYPEKAAAANPIKYVDETDPAFLIIHGDADPLVSPYESKILYQALKENNVPAELYIVSGAGHGSIEFYQPDVMNLMLDFLNKNMQ